MALFLAVCGYQQLGGFELALFPRATFESKGLGGFDLALIWVCFFSQVVDFTIPDGFV